MSKQISEWLRKGSTGWVALLALVIFLLFTALILPRQASKAEGVIGSAESPDTSFFYSAADLYRMAESYGEEGRRAYVRARFTFDVVWPLVYTLFLVTSVSWVFNKAFESDSRWQRANLLPLLGAVFDLLENISTSLVMVRFPDQTPVVDTLAGLFTALKWSLLGATFILLIAGILVALWRWTQQKSHGE